MRVYDNGRLIRTLPFSAGAPQWPTKNGVHIAIEKSPTVIMDSATVGIPKGSPNYYYEVVNWDVRISDGGAFVHSAPWSVANQGHTNVSHGCINLSPTNAEWFYKWALRGDIVDVYNSAAAVNTADPGMADWNMSWKKWVAGDAAPTAAAKALHPLLPHQDEPGFAPVPITQAQQDSTITTARRAAPSGRIRPLGVSQPSTLRSCDSTRPLLDHVLVVHHGDDWCGHGP